MLQPAVMVDITASTQCCTCCQRKLLCSNAGAQHSFTNSIGCTLHYRNRSIARGAHGQHQAWSSSSQHLEGRCKPSSHLETSCLCCSTTYMLLAHGCRRGGVGAGTTGPPWCCSKHTSSSTAAALSKHRTSHRHTSGESMTTGLTVHASTYASESACLLLAVLMQPTKPSHILLLQ